MDGEPARAVGEVVGLDPLDERAVIVLGQHAGDGMLQVEAFAEDERRHQASYRQLVADLAHVRRQRVEGGELARVRPLERDLELRQERVVVADRSTARLERAGAAPTRAARADAAARGDGAVARGARVPVEERAPTPTPTNRPAAAAAAIQRGAMRERRRAG